MGRIAYIKGIKFDPDNITDEEKEELRLLDEKGYLFIFDRDAFKEKYFPKVENKLKQ